MLVSLFSLLFIVSRLFPVHVRVRVPNQYVTTFCFHLDPLDLIPERNVNMETPQLTLTVKINFSILCYSMFLWQKISALLRLNHLLRVELNHLLINQNHN